MATISAREFNHDVSAAKRKAAKEPVIITDRGESAFVLLNIDEYRRLTGHGATIVDMLRQDDRGDFDVEFPKADLHSQPPDL